MAMSDLDYCIVRPKLLHLKATKLTGQLTEMLIEDNIPNELILEMHETYKQFNNSKNAGRNLDGKKLIEVRDKAVVSYQHYSYMGTK
jgi:hypothetical protein